MTKTCPTCDESSSLRKVVYGMPDGPLDEAKYVTGEAMNVSGGEECH